LINPLRGYPQNETEEEEVEESVKLDEDRFKTLPGKVVAKRMMGIKSMKPYAAQIAKKKNVSAIDLERELPHDKVSVKDIDRVMFWKESADGFESLRQEAFGLDSKAIKSFIEDVAKKLKMDKFSRSERARLKQLQKEAHWYSVHILGISESVDAAVNNVGGGEVAGIAPGEDPPVKKKRKKFAGCDVFEVDTDTYYSCVQGKKKFEHWKRYFDRESGVGAEIYEFAYKYPRKAIIVQNKITQEMVYLRHKRK
jgi:hypothetical protein